jgi:hypothetical protein
MYVAIEDTAGNVGVYDNPDGNAAKVTAWTSWYSSLKDINSTGYPSVVQLKAVSNFYLGVGLRCLPGNDQGFGGDGNVMFDNIRLYAKTCNPGFAKTTGGLTADFDSDCDVDINDLMILANDWLLKATTLTYPGIVVPPTAPVLWYKFNETDATVTTIADYGQTGTYTGTLHRGIPTTWNTTGGRNGQGCLYLATGGNTDVTAPPASLSFINDVNHNAGDGGGVTFSMWLNADISPGASTSSGYGGPFEIKNSAGGRAAGSYLPTPWDSTNPSGPSGQFFKFLPDGSTVTAGSGKKPLQDFGGRWNHWAFVKTPTDMLIYCNGQQYADQNAATVYGPLFDTAPSVFYIGSRYDGGSMYQGSMQDFQVYDYALTAAQIQYLATDGTGSIFLPLISPANLNLGGGTAGDANQIVNFEDMSVLGEQWHRLILWP